MTIFHAPELLNSLPGIRAGFTYANRNTINITGELTGLNLGENTRASESEIAKNFDRLSDELQWSKHHFAIAEQVHGGEVTPISEPGFYKNTDGFITSMKGLAIAVKVADCAAILLADPTIYTIAAVHAGWKGAAANILPNTIKQMEEKGGDMSKTIAYISPCISLKNFEVGEEVASQFAPTFINREIGVKPHLDLKSFLEHQLLVSGIKQKNIEIDRRCTIDDHRFYSFRRDGEKAGRMLAFIKIDRN